MSYIDFWFFECEDFWELNTEIDPNPQATREQDPKYILKNILLKEVDSVRKTLNKNLSIAERAEALVYYVRYGITSHEEFKSLTRELKNTRRIPLLQEEYLTPEEFKAYRKLVEDRRANYFKRHKE